MRYYGWIPSINRTVLLRPAVDTCTENIPRHLGHYICSFLDEPNLEGWRLCEKKELVDDLTELGLDDKKQPKHSFQLLLDKRDNPRCLFVWSAIDPAKLLWHAEILEFDLKTGMLGFTIGGFEKAEDSLTLSRATYRFIRDVYHRHVWSSTIGDYNLFPVKANDAKDAAEKIWEKYFGDRILIFMKHNIRNVYFKLNVLHTNGWKLIEELCSVAIGELVYAKALCAKMELNKDYRDACERAIITYENIKDLIDKKKARVAQRATKATSSFAIVYTFVGTSIAIAALILAGIKDFSFFKALAWGGGVGLFLTALTVYYQRLLRPRYLEDKIPFEKLA